MKFVNIISKIYWRYFRSPEEYARHLGVIIGSNNTIGYEHWSTEPYLISVGSNCQLTNCKIHTHGGGQLIREEYPDFDMFGKVSIGDWVYIGTGSQIMPGVVIEDHVIVAAGSIVTKSIPSGCVVAGNPAKIIGNIEEFKNKNLKWNVSTKGLSYDEKRKILMELPIENFIQRPFLKEVWKG